MRKITKGKEPRALFRHRVSAGADYEGFREKDALRKSLVAEQHGLCCYCMKRIAPIADKMKIEHCLSQEDYPDQQLNYRNLLGACKGGEGEPPEGQHCDTKKGGRSLSFNPASSDFDNKTKIRFLSDGEILSSDAAIKQELNDVLNLNLDRLKTNRRLELDIFKLGLTRGKNIDPAKELRKWDGSQSGELKPYSIMVVYYLRKKILRKQNKE